jgi:hypothetical protein
VIVSQSAIATTRPRRSSAKAQCDVNKLIKINPRENRVEPSNTIFNEFRAYWQFSEEMIAKASKDDLAEVARILAMQSAHYARKYGELQLPDLAHLLSATTIDDESAGLLRDSAEALVGVMAMVKGVGDVDIDATVQ